MAWTQILVVYYDLDLGDKTLSEGHQTQLVKDNNCGKYPDST